MNRTELNKLSRRELYEMAKAYDLPGRSRMSKDDLVGSLGRVSAKVAMPKPKPPKRAMAKRRFRRPKPRSSASVVKRAPHTALTVRIAAPEPHLFIDRGPELPGYYGQDKVFAMVRDPNWLYTYWDLTGGARERLAGVAASGVWVLRVYNTAAGSYDDIPVLIEGGNWYLPVASDTEYRVEIGVLDRSGKFHIGAASSPIRTPRMGISQLIDEEWLILEDEFRQLMDFSDGLATRFSGSRFLSEVIRGKQRVSGMHSAGVSSIGGSRRK